MNDIKIDLRELDRYKKKLDSISKAIFPRVVRNTLNDIGFSMMGVNGSINKRAVSNFKYQRNKSFIRGMSGLDKATGNDISKMECVAGIVRVPGKEKAARGLELQETGSHIPHKYAPQRSSRIGKKAASKVSTKSKWEHLDVININKIPKGKKLIAMINAAKNKKAIKIKGGSDNNLVAMPSKVATVFLKGGKTKRRQIAKLKTLKGVFVNFNVLYAENPNHEARIRKASPFVQEAKDISADKFYIFAMQNIVKEIKL